MNKKCSNKKKTADGSRLDACGWNSIPPDLFLKDRGRTSRNVGTDFIAIIDRFSKGKQILELCSGGGRLLIQLARAGFDVTGIDLSKDMLAASQKEIAKENKIVRNRIMLVEDDMCTFDLNKKFDFIILEDDGFMYLLTKEDQLNCLKQVYEHLDDTGLFFLSFATPQKELSSTDDFEYDALSQIKTQSCAWTIINNNGKWKIIKQGLERRRMTYPEELERLLTTAKLTPVARWGDLQMHPFTDPATQEYNYLIKKLE